MQAIVNGVGMKGNTAQRSMLSALEGLGFTASTTQSWSDVIKQVTADWSSYGGQLLLNKNPAPLYSTTAQGTTVYAPTGSVLSPQTPVPSPNPQTQGGIQGQVGTAGASLSISTGTLLLIGGGALALILLMNRR